MNLQLLVYCIASNQKECLMLEKYVSKIYLPKTSRLLIIDNTGSNILKHDGKVVTRRKESLNRIIVNYVDKNTHTLRIFFKIPYINDRLIWKNEKNKKLGYEIKRGLKSIYINYDEKKLYVDKRQKKTLNSK